MKTLKRKSFNGSLFIYSSEGIEELTISNFGLITKAIWSPDSKKIVIKVLGQNGFNIIYLGKNNQLKVNKNTSLQKTLELNWNSLIVLHGLQIPST